MRAWITMETAERTEISIPRKNPKGLQLPDRKGENRVEIKGCWRTAA